ncbi:hypothetical protein VNI00_004558 [Paramarasmius palmivorus]|uniref:F-box domain-containing protein n=1 Tax=Paramarasmius palmivorus TaxID=297713 RepID=A0AAW0DKJ1_9AGAR
MDTVGLGAAKEMADEKALSPNLQNNPDTAVFRLPPDVMVNVFGYCVPSHGSEEAGTSWLSFSHVCRVWRLIALDHGLLWTCIDLRRVALSELMIERSKAAALDIRAPCLYERGSKTKRLLGKLQSQLFRIRNLQLNIGVVEMGLGFLKQLLQPAPCLRSLEVIGHNLILPEDFLAHTAPLLTHLRLEGTYLSWKSPLFFNLTILELCGDGKTNIPAAKQLLDVLRASPHLESLRLAHIFPNRIDRVEDVHFHKLRKLRISGDAAKCSGLLDNLSFPETTALSVDCSVEIEDNVSFKSFIVSHFPRLFLANQSFSTEFQDPCDQARIMKTLFIDLEEQDDVPQVTLDAWNNDVIPIDAFNSYEPSDEVERRLPSPCIHISFVWDRHQDLPNVAEDRDYIFSELPMQSVETLHIRGPNVVDEHNSNSVLRCFRRLALNSSSVKTLILDRGGFSDQFTQVFNLLRTMDTTVSPPVLAFPALHSLALLFRDVMFWQGSPGYPPGRSSFGGLLLETLAFRSQRGQAVKALVAKSCKYLTSEEVAWFEALPVEEFRWID